VTQSPGHVTLASFFDVFTSYDFGNPLCSEQARTCITANPDTGRLQFVNNSAAEFTGILTLNGQAFGGIYGLPSSSPPHHQCGLGRPPHDHPCSFTSARHTILLGPRACTSAAAKLEGSKGPEARERRIPATEDARAPPVRRVRRAERGPAHRLGRAQAHPRLQTRKRHPLQRRLRITRKAPVVASHSSAGHIVVRRNEIVESKATAMYFGCHDELHRILSDLVMERDFIRGVEATEGEIGYGLQVKLNSTATISDNVIVDTKGPGIMVYGASECTAPRTPRTSARSSGTSWLGRGPLRQSWWAEDRPSCATAWRPPALKPASASKTTAGAARSAASGCPQHCLRQPQGGDHRPWPRPARREDAASHQHPRRPAISST
jgi:hypothetical protein